MKSIRTTLIALLMTGFCLLGMQSAVAGVLLDGGENKLLDNFLRGQTNTLPATNYLALGTNACSDAGTPTEPSGNGYARASIASTLANWSGTQGAGTTVASTGTSGTTSNNVVITFAASTGAWASGANLVSIWFMDAASAGNPWICITLTSPIAVTATGFTLTFPAAALSFQIDN